MHRCVVLYESAADRDRAGGHERHTRDRLARQIARLIGCEHAGEYEAGRRYPEPTYFVPSRTLVGLAAAHALGIHGERDLFGGVVPHAFVATKTITHPLVDAAARVPPGWSHAVPARVQDVVLDGLSAFAIDDARRAGERLLGRHREVRVKPGTGIGGRHQAVVRTARELDHALAAIAPEELATCGVVLEENLRDVATYSVGQIRIADLVASYVGTQRLTEDNRGAEVYGGTDLIVARGDFGALLAHADLDPAERLAIAQARTYDAAARELFAGLLASRSNYDVARGIAGDGRPKSGVLEQSWRVGGASSAEIGALEALVADPQLRIVRASCIERYGRTRATPPRRAVVYFDGVDEHVGALLKYCVVEAA